MGTQLEVKTYDPSNLGPNPDGKSDIEMIRTKFRIDCENARFMDGHDAYSGSIAQFYDFSIPTLRPFDTYDDAEEFISENHSKRDPAFAVRFNVVVDRKPSAKLEKAKAAAKKALENLNEVSRIIRVDMRNHKSKLITCRRCGSKINRKYLVFHDGQSVPLCPACHTTLMLLSQKKKYENAKAKLIKAEEKLLCEQKSDSKKHGKTMWLVGGLVGS